MNKRKKNQPPAWGFVLLILVAIILSMLLLKEALNALIPTLPFGLHIIPRELIEFLETIQWVNLFLTTLNGIILTYLLYTYVKIYQEIRSQFSLGLIALASALLAHTISANPIVAILFGFHSTGLGPFAVIPSIFTLFAALVLLHLSRQ